MTTALTENPANADFATGLPVPQAGVDDFPTAAAFISVASLQELADRTQLLRTLAGAKTDGTRQVGIPIGSPVNNVSSRFTLVNSSGAHYWQQTDVSGFGTLTFEVTRLPVGATITEVIAWWANNADSALPATMPSISLTKNVYSVGAGADPGTYDSGVAAGSDTTALIAAYKLMHKVSLSGLAEVVTEDTVYRVNFFGETGANSTIGGNLAAISIRVR